MIRIGKYPNASDSFSTPQWVLSMFEGAFDPCPFNEEWDDSHYDGLKEDWPLEGRIFVNPPYSNVMPWVEKALHSKFQSNMQGKKLSIIMLLKHDSSTRWFAKLQEGGARFLMFQGRLVFENKSKKTMWSSSPSVLAVI